MLRITQVLSTSPLYQEIELAEVDWSTMRDLFCKHFNMDLYCPECERVSTFATSVRGVAAKDDRPEAAETVAGLAYGNYSWQANFWETKKQTDFSLTMYCSRNYAHIAKFYFVLRDKKLIKVGQRPSLADMASAEVRTYQKVLGSERVKELQRAIGLAAHGVGVGSFVYLRRIFESLIEDHRKAADPDGTLFPDWNQKRTNERVKALSASLPDFLVKNTQLHGVLSAGVHTLSEDQCRTAFPVVKSAIMLILQQDHERAERARIEKALAADLTKISSELGEIR